MPLIFLHIPKAGGNSFLDFLLPNFEFNRRFDVNQGLSYADRLRELEELEEIAKKSIELVYGHLPFGVHESFSTPSRYITVLRHPIDRIASHYYFVKEQPSHPLYTQVTGQQLSLSQYATSGLSGELNNGMTRLICGRRAADSLRGHSQCFSSDLDQAIEHLDQHFEVVGLLESLAATQKLLSTLYQWPMQEPVQLNKTRRRTPTNQLSESEKEAIASENELDLQLYQWAELRFAEQCAEHGIDANQAPKRRSPLSWIPGWKA